MSGRGSRGADASDAQRAAKRQKRVDGRKQPRTWEESRARLEAYRDAHRGDCNVPCKWKDDPQLGRWVDKQKVQLRKYEADPATSQLSAERVAALRQMGAIDSWLERSRTWEDDPQLGMWVHRQKVQWRKYEADPAASWLSSERVAALRQMGAIDSWRSRERRSRASAREPLGQKSYVLFEV